MSVVEEGTRLYSTRNLRKRKVDIARMIFIYYLHVCRRFDVVLSWLPCYSTIYMLPLGNMYDGAGHSELSKDGYGLGKQQNETELLCLSWVELLCLSWVARSAHSFGPR